MDEHPEVNASHLVSGLLGEYIEAFNAAQPEKVKLILKLRALKIELEKAEEEMINAEPVLSRAKSAYNDQLNYFNTLKLLAQLPAEQLKIAFNDDKHSIAYVSDAKCSKRFNTEYIELQCGNQKEPAHIHTIVLQQLQEAEGIDYQNRLQKLKQDIQLPQNIYNTFKAQVENIRKQIAEIEGLIIRG